MQRRYAGLLFRVNAEHYGGQFGVNVSTQLHQLPQLAILVYHVFVNICQVGFPVNPKTLIELFIHASQGRLSAASGIGSLTWQQPGYARKT